MSPLVSESSEAPETEYIPVSSNCEGDTDKFREFVLHTSAHRSQLKADRENLSRVQLEKINYQNNGHVDRRERMEELYGPYYQDVASLEAKVSLRYETYCDENQPILWPVLPLKL